MKVGDLCTVERSTRTGALVHRYAVAITRITPKRAYLGDDWFALDDPQRIVKPRYLDYVTRVVAIAEAAVKS